MTRPWWYDDEEPETPDAEAPDFEGVECMDCGHSIEQGEEVNAEPGEAPSRHCPGAAPHIAHTVCPVVCAECGKRYQRDEFGDEKEGARWTQAFCRCGHPFNVPVW